MSAGDANIRSTMTKVVERELARQLRREEGESINVIAARLGVAVSSVSRWVRDIELAPEQQAALERRNPRFGHQRASQESQRRAARRRRLAWQEEGRAMARLGDPLHRAGCMLHWAEGSKKRCAVCFSNSDVAMMQLFARFLRECFAVADDRLTFSVNCFLGNGLTLAAIEDHWLEALALPRSCLRKATVNRPSAASRRKGRVLLYGTGRLTLHSTQIAQHIYGAIQEYAGFERPEWLD